MRSHPESWNCRLRVIAIRDNSPLVNPSCKQFFGGFVHIQAGSPFIIDQFFQRLQQLFSLNVFRHIRKLSFLLIKVFFVFRPIFTREANGIQILDALFDPFLVVLHAAFSLSAMHIFTFIILYRRKKDRGKLPPSSLYSAVSGMFSAKRPQPILGAI